MRKTQFIELLHTIGKTWVSFVSIVMFIMLGAGIFLGLSWIGLGLLQGADNDYDTYSFHDFDIQFAYGINDADMAEIAATEGVSSVEGGYTAYATFRVDGEGHVAHILSSTKDVDKMRVIEGTAPVAANEAALDSIFAEKYNIAVGDTISFETIGTSPLDGSELLNGHAYTVTAIVAQPAYALATSSARGMSNLSVGATDSFIILPSSAFNVAAYDNCYTNAYVRCDSLDSLATFGSAYTTKSDTIRESLVTLGADKGASRYKLLHDAAQAKIDEGQKKVDEGQAQVTDGQQQIDAGEAQAASGEEQISEGREKIAEARETLDYYQALADEARNTIDNSLTQTAAALVAKGAPGGVDAVKAQLRDMLDEAATSGRSVADIAREKGVSEDLISMYGDEAQSKLEEYRDFKNKEAQLEQGWDEYYEGEETLNDLEEQLAEGKEQLAEAKTKLAEATVQLDEGKAQLESVKANFSQMREYGWSISGRSDNTSSIGMLAFRDSTDRLRYSMALVFIIVGLLVCYSAVSRIVREQVVNIGTKKALGLRSGEINLAYLLYSGIAVLIGVVLAIVVAVIIQSIIISNISGQFSLTMIPIYLSAPDTIFIGLIELVFILLATWLACRRMLKRRAVELLRGNEPPKNKTRFFEKWKFWNKMPLYSQSIINNFFNDKARVIGTIVGVAGCTALVVIAMTLYLNILKTFNMQFEEVYAYESHVSFDASAADAQSTLEGIVANNGAQATAVFKQVLGLNEPDGSMSALTVFVPENVDQFTQFYHIRSTDGSSVTLDSSGIWLSQAYGEHRNAKPGDMLRVIDTTGTVHEIPIAGFMQYHLNQHEMIMTSELYEQVFGVTPKSNTLLISLDDSDESTIISQAEQVKGFFAYGNDLETNTKQFAVYQSLTTTVVYIYLALSALMALVVLMNLMVTFIDEKKRDLIVLRINGFSTHAAKAYIYRDTILLTIIGIIIGILIGMTMGSLSLISIEFSSTSYVLTPSLVACLVGAAASAVFAFIVSVIALRRIPRFNLTDINRM